MTKKGFSCFREETSLFFEVQQKRTGKTLIKGSKIAGATKDAGKEVAR